MSRGARNLKRPAGRPESLLQEPAGLMRITARGRRYARGAQSTQERPEVAGKATAPPERTTGTAGTPATSWPWGRSAWWASWPAARGGHGVEHQHPGPRRTPGRPFPDLGSHALLRSQFRVHDPPTPGMALFKLLGPICPEPPPPHASYEPFETNRVEMLRSGVQ